MASNKNPDNADNFPILCETCLGPNPYVRMQKQPWGTACKICERPFTCFRWRPAGSNTRPKKTEICQTCARAKNVCQTCILDLKYGLPVQVRDASMAKGDLQRTVVPMSDATREYTVAQSQKKIENGVIDQVYNAAPVNDLAEKAKRTKPRYERNRTRICTFYLRGNCTRGLYCPYRHEKPDEKQQHKKMGEQNIRDRYYGVNDPVAKNILHNLGVSADGKYRRLNKTEKGNNSPPNPPEDQSIKSLFISGITNDTNQSDIKSFLTEIAAPTHIRMLSDRGIGFAEFQQRQEAEAVMKVLYGPHEINGERIYINWARPPNKRPRSTENSHENLSLVRKENILEHADRTQKTSETTKVDIDTTIEQSPKRMRNEQDTTSISNDTEKSKEKNTSTKMAKGLAFTTFAPPIDNGDRDDPAVPPPIVDH